MELIIFIVSFIVSLTSTIFAAKSGKLEKSYNYRIDPWKVLSYLLLNWVLSLALGLLLVCNPIAVLIVSALIVILYLSVFIIVAVFDKHSNQAKIWKNCIDKLNKLKEGKSNDTVD